MGWAKRVARMGEMQNVYKILVEKSKRKRLIGRSENRRMYNIMTSLVVR